MPDERTIDLADVSLFVRCSGPPDAPVLLVLHGGPGWDHPYLLPALDDLTDVRAWCWSTCEAAGILVFGGMDGAISADRPRTPGAAAEELDGEVRRELLRSWLNGTAHPAELSAGVAALVPSYPDGTRGRAGVTAPRTSPTG